MNEMKGECLEQCLLIHNDISFSGFDFIWVTLTNGSCKNDYIQDTDSLIIKYLLVWYYSLIKIQIETNKIKINQV